MFVSGLTHHTLTRTSKEALRGRACSSWRIILCPSLFTLAVFGAPFISSSQTPDNSPTLTFASNPLGLSWHRSFTLWWFRGCPHLDNCSVHDLASVSLKSALNSLESRYWDIHRPSLYGGQSDQEGCSSSSPTYRQISLWLRMWDLWSSPVTSMNPSIMFCLCYFSTAYAVWQKSDLF